MKTKKHLGQHWLHDRVILNEIAGLAVTPPFTPFSVAKSKKVSAPIGKSVPLERAEIVYSLNFRWRAPELCIEIGPGLGTLTSCLFRYFSEVVAIEFDPDLARKLPDSFPGKNLRVINADVLQTDLAAIADGQPYCVTGNIPYYITSPIIHQLLETHPLPHKIVLLIQREVAERIDADPGEQNLLSLFVQNLALVELGPVVRAAEFTPPPKVDSQIIVLTPHAPEIPPECLRLARRGFSHPRKKLVTNLADATHSRDDWKQILAAYDINPDARPSDLTLSDWKKLDAAYNSTS